MTHVDFVGETHNLPKNLDLILTYMSFNNSCLYRSMKTGIIEATPRKKLMFRCIMS